MCFENFLSFPMKPATITPHRQFVGEKLTFLVAETTVYGACFYMFSWCFAIINMQNNYFYIHIKTKIYFFVINSAGRQHCAAVYSKKKPGRDEEKPQIMFRYILRHRRIFLYTTNYTNKSYGRGSR
jgi:hypothetical protein